MRKNKGEKRNSITPKKWFAIGDLWIGVTGIYVADFFCEGRKWWKSFEREWFAFGNRLEGDRKKKI